MDATKDVNFPMAIDDVDPEKNLQLKSYYTGFGPNVNFVKVGPKGYLLFNSYREEANEVYNFKVRSTDTVVASFPRSGTTWTQELVWLVANDLDYAGSKALPLIYRYFKMGSTIVSQPMENLRNESAWEQLAKAEGPRFIKTHMPISLLAPSLVDTAKVVYIARDPRDVTVSFYYCLQLLKIIEPNNNFRVFWNMFITDLVFWQPYFEHVKEAWQLRHHPNMLFLFYEELNKDLPSSVRRVAKFLNKQYTDEQFDGLCKHLNFDNFKNNESVNISLDKNLKNFISEEHSFIRKGKSGGWREYFDAEMTLQAERWIADNLRNTDLRFPSMKGMEF